jgi:hypothetical protein
MTAFPRGFCIIPTALLQAHQLQPLIFGTWFLGILNSRKGIRPEQHGDRAQCRQCSPLRFQPGQYGIQHRGIIQSLKLSTRDHGGYTSQCVARQAVVRTGSCLLQSSESQDHYTRCVSCNTHASVLGCSDSDSPRLL